MLIWCALIGPRLREHPAYHGLGFAGNPSPGKRAAPGGGILRMPVLRQRTGREGNTNSGQGERVAALPLPAPLHSGTVPASREVGYDAIEDVAVGRRRCLRSGRRHTSFGRTGADGRPGLEILRRRVEPQRTSLVFL